MTTINGVRLSVRNVNGGISHPAYEAHSMAKVIEIVNATWRLDNVADVEEVEIY
jgi:hypothetical protein